MPAMAMVKEMHQGTGKQQQEWKDAEQVGAMLGDQEETRDGHEPDQHDPERKAPPGRRFFVVVHGVTCVLSRLYIMPIGPILMVSAIFFCSSLNDA